ncbi:MAG TPA: hypothetical protein V6C57_27625 [Coleofasciculaceae cyanobacterium]
MNVKSSGSEINVTNAADQQDQPAIAVSAYGQFAIVWQGENQDGTSTEIYQRLYRSTGTPIGQAFQVNKTSANDQTDPAVGMDETGNSVVVWSSENSNGTDKDIYAQRIADNGKRLGPQFLVNTSTTGDQTVPAVDMDLDGSFVVTWTSSTSSNDSTNGQDTSGTGVYAQRFMPNGTPIGREFRVNSTTAGDQQNSAIALNSKGDYVIAWESGGQDGSGKGIFAQRYSSNGTRRGSEFQVNSTTDNDQDHPSVGMDAAGDYVIVWEGEDDNGTGIYAQRYSAHGNPQGSEFRVNSTTDGDQSAPSVGMDAEGNFTVTWASDNDGYGVYAQHYDLNGNRSGDEFQVNQSQNQDQTEPAIGAALNGNFTIAWVGDSQNDHQENDIYAQQYVAGAQLLPPGTIKGTPNNDTLWGTGDNNKIYGYGGNDTLYGYPKNATSINSNDQLYGGAGNDQLYGGAGNDSLSGSTGADSLNGGSGRDTLYGGSGQDTLKGGGGNDIFKIGQASGADRITDFKKGSDRLTLLEGLQFKNLNFQYGTSVRVRVGSDTIALIQSAGSPINNANPITAADFTNP